MKYTYHASLFNTASSISTSVRYYSNTNNIDMVVIFISSAPSNSTTYHFATPDIIAKYHVTMAVSLIIFEKQRAIARRKDILDNIKQVAIGKLHLGLYVKT